MDHYYSKSSYGDPYSGVLELCLKDILSCIKPSEHDRLRRLYTIAEITTLVQSVQSLKDVVIKPFGSFTSNLYTKWGDLDTSVQLSHCLPSSVARKRKLNVLRDIMKILRKNGVARNFTLVPSARVPLLKFESYRHNVSCDLSVDNHMGWMKSRILLWLSEIDERLRDMVLLTKEWAKAHDINDPKSGTLNSYSLCLLVIFLFQTCKPAILPPLKYIYGGNFCNFTGTWSSIESEVEGECAANIARFKSFRQRNQSTMSELFDSFFDKYREIGRLSSEYVISTYTGQLESIESNPGWMKKPYQLIIEDPFERPDNAARAVGPRELSMISEAFMSTSQMLSSYSLIPDRNALLSNLVRRGIRPQLKFGTQSNHSSQSSHETPCYAISAYATDDDPVDKKSSKSSRVEVGTQNHHIFKSKQEKPPNKSSESSRPNAGTHSHYTPEGNQDKSRVAFTGFAVGHSINGLNHKKPSTELQSHYGKSQSSSSARAINSLDNQRSKFASINSLDNQRSKFASESKVRPQSKFTAEGHREIPQVAFIGYAAASPPVVNRERQGHGNAQVQQVWKPRNQNR
ncbi:uncharacterized protein A4U43_C02F970 [Asparagus officinalis]|uniref:Poly(A) RNA polymerase mitochondrial-like central palm domain-containing protein n=1 Tax=Asparagus officinalis TaxID=4686 RepID=A0A5P1FEU9_ASPOF|nr:protein HESO1 [Asparagus officinalis]ONK76896.1 uncharacterized protein A4U43_C02F970 [Asparagus officinalis]